MIRSGSSLSNSSPVFPFGASMIWYPCVVNPMRSSLRNRRFIIDDENFGCRRVHAAVSSGWDWSGIGRRMVKAAPRPVWPISRDDRAVHRLDETARDGQPKAGSSADLVCLL